MLRLLAILMLLAAPGVGAEPPEQPDPRRDPARGIDPAYLRGGCSDGTGYCEWPPFLRPWNLYVLEIGDAQLLAMAKDAPAAAMYAALMQIDGLAQPMPVEVNDSVHSMLVTTEAIAAMVRGPMDAESVARTWKTLDADVGFLTRSRVERLRNGHRLIVVESELLHHPTLSTVGVPYPPCAIEIERVDGKIVPTERADSPARVWRVLSWGPPGGYYAPD